MVTEVTNESWFGRIGNAIKGVLIGIVLFAISIALLFWNEGRAVHRAKDLKEGISNVQSDVSADKVDPAYDHKLVHMISTATTEEAVRDDMFDVSSPKTLKLQRVAQMYQWKENEESTTEKKLGGGTETVTQYTYEKVWAAHRIDSGDFHPEGASEYGEGNPEMAVRGDSWTADPITFGAFTMSPSLISHINTYERIPVTEAALQSLSEEDRTAWHVTDGTLYRSFDREHPSDPKQPAIGDIRVEFEIVKPVEVSLISEQIGNSFRPFQATYGTVEDLEIGRHGSDEMFAKMEQENRTMTWLLRGGGFVLMAVGIGLVFRPLAVFADVIPLLGNILGAGTAIFAIVIAAAVSLVTISIAWLVYRPLLGIALIVVAVGIVVGAIMLFRKRKPAT